jgi:hypothetical protein
MTVAAETLAAGGAVSLSRTASSAIMALGVNSLASSLTSAMIFLAAAAAPGAYWFFPSGFRTSPRLMLVDRLPPRISAFQFAFQIILPTRYESLAERAGQIKNEQCKPNDCRVGGHRRALRDPDRSRREAVIALGPHHRQRQPSSGNHAALDYLDRIGSLDSLGGPGAAVFDFADLKSGERWRLRLNEGREDGFWNEPFHTATGFPRVFYLRYHGYSKFFPLWALARFRNLKRGNSRAAIFGI